MVNPNIALEAGPSWPQEYAAFAVMSRLLSCLVTEEILPALYIALDRPEISASGFMVVYTNRTNFKEDGCKKTSSPDDVFAIVPLRHEPIFRDNPFKNIGWPIGLVDPLDMLPFVYELTKLDSGEQWDTEPLFSALFPTWASSNRIYVHRIQDPVSLWRNFSNVYSIDNSICDDIEKEIRSSFSWQTVAFENPPSCPSFHSTPIEWEQSLVTGHPTHPMHRTRLFSPKYLEYDWYHPRIRFVRVMREDLDMNGDFEQLSRRVAAKAAENAGQVLSDDTSFIYMPVHELQIENITSKFGKVEVLGAEISILAQAQSSIRTLEVSEFPGLAFKLAIGVKISSALRTISHFTANFGPRFSRDIIPKLAVNPENLHIELEPCSAVYRTPDPEVAKHFTAVIREKYKPPNGQVVIVVAALLETGHAGHTHGMSAVEHVFGLDSESKKEAFLERYIRMACQAFLPPLIENGVAFEAHAQNVLVRFDAITKELRGFVIRDLGGLRIYPAALRASTGVNFQFLDGHVVATSSLEEIFPKFYHTFVHNHIQRLIRLLGMHYNGRGWEILRTHMAKFIPVQHPVWKLWMDPLSKTVESKCLMRMRLRNSYRNMVHHTIPNLIQYRGDETLGCCTNHSKCHREKKNS